MEISHYLVGLILNRLSSHSHIPDQNQIEVLYATKRANGAETNIIEPLFFGL